MVKAVHFGAGNIGRGFVGQLYFQSKFDLVFLDVADSIVGPLSKADHYTIYTVDGDAREPFTVDNYRIIHSGKDKEKALHELATADIISCSVGPKIMELIAKLLADGLLARNLSTHPHPAAIIACENQLNATDALEGYIRSHMKGVQDIGKRAQFANCAIDRIVPTQRPNIGVDVEIERHYEWCIDQRNLNPRPNIHGVHWVDNIEPYIDRKLWTVNTGHATIAYHGRQYGTKTIRESIQVPEIAQAVRDTLAETGALIQKRYKFSPQEQQQYIDTIISRFENKGLDDTCVRVGRAPLRKLSKNERFIRPAEICLQEKLPIDNLLKGIEKGLRFTNVDDVAPDGKPMRDQESYDLRTRLQTKSARDAALETTGLDANGALFKRVLPLFEAAKAELH